MPCAFGVQLFNVMNECNIGSDIEAACRHTHIRLLLQFAHTGKSLASVSSFRPVYGSPLPKRWSRNVTRATARVAMAESWRYLGSSRCASRLPILTAGNPSAPSGFQRPGVCNRSERSGHTTRGRCERFRVQDYLRELGDWPPRDASGTRPARCVSCDLGFSLPRSCTRSPFMTRRLLGIALLFATTAAVGEHQFVDVTPTFVQPSMSDSGEVIGPARP